MAQRPDGPGEGPPESADDFVARMIAFDKNKDGRLSKDELTDTRLHRLFERADADRDGVVTKQELSALAARELADDGGGPPGFGPPRFGPPGGPRGGPMMAPPRPGEVLPAMIRQRLGLSDEQKKQVDELQKDVDDRLAKILTSEQKTTLQEMRGRFGRPGGPRGFPPDGPPPGERVPRAQE
jgi:hypothetical protein